MTRRRRRETHSEAFWSRHIQDWRESGLTQQAYCELHGLAASTFHARRRRLAVNGSPRNDVAAATQFEIVPLGTPITVSRPAVQDVGRVASPFVLVIASGRYRVELQEGASQAALSQILDTLEARL